MGVRGFGGGGENARCRRKRISGSGGWAWSFLGCFLSWLITILVYLDSISMTLFATVCVLQSYVDLDRSPFSPFVPYGGMSALPISWG